MALSSEDDINRDERSSSGRILLPVRVFGIFRAMIELPPGFLANRIRVFLRRVVPRGLRPLAYLTRLTKRRTGRVVRSGPFAGMRYLESSLANVYIPKLLGIYERELTPWVEKIISLRPDLIADVGAAEGYYAVGFATRLSDVRIIAFDGGTAAQQSIRTLAALNDVSSQLDVRGWCEPADLRNALAVPGCRVILCDVEGYESTLLNPTAVPELRGCHILAESHDSHVPGMSHLLGSRFETTHDIARIYQQPRSRSEFPFFTLATLLLPRNFIDRAVSEGRSPDTQWLWLAPKRTA